VSREFGSYTIATYRFTEEIGVVEIKISCIMSKYRYFQRVNIWIKEVEVFNFFIYQIILVLFTHSASSSSLNFEPLTIVT